ncbi:MAG: hypothetical protein RL065_2265 [Bacteroidota bacterium]|jgi:hypothetical protein
MLTINTILKEMKDVPVSKLEDIYQFVHSLTVKEKPDTSEKIKSKLLSYSGLLSEMNEKDYSDFVHHTKLTRANNFNRNVDL